MFILEDKDLKKTFSSKIGMFLLIVYSIFLAISISIKFDYFNNLTFGTIMLDIFVMVLMLLASFVISVIGHEFGHMVFGLITGYSFYSFQVFNIKIFKDDKLHIKIVNNMLLGQCILKNDKDVKEAKFKLYLYGGALFNLLSMLILLLISIIIFILNKNISLFLLILSWANYYMFYSNGIPININGIYNDALNLKLMKKYNYFKELILYSLNLQYELETKKSINEIDVNLIQFGLAADDTVLHKYQFALSETIRRIVNNEDNQFELLLSIHKIRYMLPIQYKYSNIIFILYYYLLNDISYKGIINDKCYQKLFKKAKNIDGLLEICLEIIKYKEGKINKQDVINFIISKDEELDKKYETLIQKECYKKMYQSAMDYLTFESESNNESNM